MFWTIHDPTQGDRQGNDIGSQYRSAILYLARAKDTAQETFEIYQAAINEAGFGNITTQITAAVAHTYYPAEDYHQKYLAKTQMDTTVMPAPESCFRVPAPMFNYLVKKVKTS
jgi:Peptide methionine sulfoxide reductase